MTSLLPRKRVLAVLGITENVSRSSWSHDDGERIYFDAWTDEFVNLRYPMCTVNEYSLTAPYESKGRTRWIRHLGLCLTGERETRIKEVPPMRSAAKAFSIQSCVIGFILGRSGASATGGSS